jgi:hypothetical protein
MDMKNRKLWLALIGLLALAPSLALASLQVGDQAPDFSIPDTAWVNHQLSQYRGQVVQLMFWQNF